MDTSEKITVLGVECTLVPEASDEDGTTWIGGGFTVWQHLRLESRFDIEQAVDGRGYHLMLCGTGATLDAAIADLQSARQHVVDDTRPHLAPTHAEEVAAAALCALNTVAGR